MRFKHKVEVNAPQLDDLEDKVDDVLEKKDKLIKRAVPFLAGAVVGALAVKMFSNSNTTIINNYLQAIED